MYATRNGLKNIQTRSELYGCEKIAQENFLSLLNHGNFSKNKFPLISRVTNMTRGFTKSTKQRAVS